VIWDVKTGEDRLIRVNIDQIAWGADGRLAGIASLGKIRQLVFYDAAGKQIGPDGEKRPAVAEVLAARAKRKRMKELRRAGTDGDEARNEAEAMVILEHAGFRIMKGRGAKMLTLVLGTGKPDFDEALSACRVIETPFLLDLREAPITRDVIAPLARADSLQGLATGKPWEQTMMFRLSRLNALKYFRAQNCGFGDSDARILLRLKKLEVLDLGEHKFSDAALETLTQLKSLRRLRLDPFAEAFSEEAIAAFRKSRPKVTLEAGGQKPAPRDAPPEPSRR
jgi:hypothetical protein